MSSALSTTANSSSSANCTIPLPSGHHWCGRINKNHVLTLKSLAANANASLYVVNADEKLERFNMPDSLKAQHTLYLSKGHVLYSDLGRVLASIISDDHGWNDAICGPSTAAMIKSQYGEKTFQDARNDRYQNALDGLLTEMTKFSLDERDLTATLNLFSKVTSDSQGQLSYINADNTEQSISLRFEMNCLVFICNAPHPLDPSTSYDPADIELTLQQAAPIAPMTESDVCRDSCEQNQRGFMNNARYFGDYANASL
ncbi:urea amidolyase associated protein UAAP1 [Psychrobacter sp.]|uniref:urea amidolyase associated protein UAAP1 n=1 Tax=Psychrobacter sp. TaxID=56811 RepID=UPI003F9A3FA9